MRNALARRITVLLVAVALFAAPVGIRSADPPVNLVLPARSSAVPADTLLDPEAAEWQGIPAQRVGLNRTPPLYETDPPAVLEVSWVDVRIARAGRQLIVHLTWLDAAADQTELAQAPSSPPETRVLKEPTAATERFFDAAAVMFPSTAAGGAFTPSLQMGDAGQPVTIYYWNAARGAMLMDAQGRGTTRRTGASFRARGVHRGGRWLVTLEMSDLAAGVPLAFAVWNGSQQDRDGRKYFSVWHWLQ